MNLIIIFSGQGLQNAEHLVELNVRLSNENKKLFEKIMPLEKVDFYNIFDNKIAQPLIFSLQHLRYQSLVQAVGMPMTLAGYSLGEVSAWCCSMNLSFTHGLEIVKMRAKIMQNNTDTHAGLMSIQGLNQDQIQMVISDSGTFLSIKQSETQYIIAGEHLNLDKAKIVANSLGAQYVKQLNVSIASHSPLMEAADGQFLNYLHGLDLPNMSVPIISTTNATKYENNNKAKKILANQIGHALDWHLCVQSIKEYQPDVILEIGPGNALSKIVGAQIPDVPCRSYDDFTNEKGVIDWLEKHLYY